MFQKEGLHSFDNEVIHILKSGIRNRNAGPDFLNAKIEINHQMKAWNVEIYSKSSDWYAHNFQV